MKLRTMSIAGLIAVSTLAGTACATTGQATDPFISEKSATTALLGERPQHEVQIAGKLPVNASLASTASLLANNRPSASPSKTPPQNSLVLPYGNEPDLMIVAHRGQWRTYPENSVQGIVQAAEDGADIVEITVCPTVPWKAP